ncbi:uncharacterized protein LOC113468082 [Diaphorina citri]|uniref:Uncharacterized protein LOC113468082 n=1 Tax=Diaphorina citri TaxID=121845 RepID=A0A3Q0IWA6_DIACI|nr:uncharacterized protein LOC113468082 [Diaphorina citri]
MDVECQRLLSQLKSTVEQICNVEFSNGTSQGTLSDLYEAVASIFKHECKIFDRHGEPDVRGFVQGLTWLQPSLFRTTFVLVVIIGKSSRMFEITIRTLHLNTISTAGDQSDMNNDEFMRILFKKFQKVCNVKFSEMDSNTT